MANIKVVAESFFKVDGDFLKRIRFRHLLYIDGVYSDITDEVKPNFKINYDIYDGNTCDFELKTGEKFYGIRLETEVFSV